MCYGSARAGAASGAGGRTRRGLPSSYAEMNLEVIAERAFAPVAAAVASGRIPGAALGVLANGARAVRWTGAAQREPVQVTLKRGTWFDLASLTKVIFTTTAILR